MKISKSLADVYSDLEGVYHTLKGYVDDVIISKKNPRWHYESRIKDAESFALKIETGRFKDPSSVDDFFAATIVVENTTYIPKAREMLGRFFCEKSCRPRDTAQTHKRPESFDFDDLRLYCTVEEYFKHPEICGMIFEVQIKTFLQHAWSIATHDLIYKSASPNWSMSRIAYQIKAMLEHAELSISEAESLSTSVLISKTDNEYRIFGRICALIDTFWEDESLPKDRKRLVANFNNILRVTGVDLDRVAVLLEEETSIGRGAARMNLSPYSAMIQVLFDRCKEDVISALRREVRFPLSPIVVVPEVELDDSIRQMRLPSAIFVQKEQRV